MKTIKLFSIFFALVLLILQNNTKAQSLGNKRSWSTDNPFRSNVFVENHGQFDKWIADTQPIKYAINNADNIFFTPQGLIFKLRKTEILTEEEREKRESKASEEITRLTESFFITMTWEDCDTNTLIEASERAEGYFTFGEEGYESVKASGYKKLKYINLYPGIDVEYIIPKKGGIKYTLIVHPGADISRVKMKYTGDVDNIRIDDNGNMIIKTPAGDIIDHVPVSYIQSSGDTITSSFELKDNTVSFKLDMPESGNHQPATIIIDPWTITPSYLISDYAAYDIAFDDFENAYVSGGTYQFKLAKYSNTGSFIWGFTNPVGWSPSWSCYSRFCLLPNSGTVFIGEAANPSGPRVMKINSSGTLIHTTPNFYGNEEIWVMFYNRCTGQLAGFGGGTQLANNLQLIADTNLTGSTIKNFNYSTNPRNDIASVEMDYNGDFYALMSSQSNPNSNHIMKSLVSTGYNPPPAFDVSTGYDFYETNHSGIPGFTPNNVTTRANALALNNNYLFSYDGKTLRAWNKSTGSSLGSVVVNTAYTGGQYRSHEGIAVDDCDRVYLGANGSIRIYTFNGSSFTGSNPITANIQNEVYDVRLDKVTQTLYVSGLGFVTVVPAIVCNSGNVLNITDNIDNCLGSACVNVSGGTPPYSYIWSNGATTDCINGLQSGTYIVTVSDNSCIVQRIIDTITIDLDVVVDISGDTVICVGSSTALTASGASNYVWSPATGLSSTTGPNVTASPLATTIYTVTGTLNGCPGMDSITIYVNPQPSAFLGNDTIICGAASIVLNAANPGLSYLWSTGETTQTITVSSAGSYSVTVSDLTCTGADTINVDFVPPPEVNIGNDTTICPGETVLLDAQNQGASYLWSTGETTQSITINQQGTYWVIINIGNCVASDTIIIHMVANINLGLDQSLCFQPQDTLGNNIQADWYLWSTGETSPQIIVSEPGQYWLTVFKNNCILSDTVLVKGGFISLYAPNAFTPDNDGLNDIFKAYGEGITEFDLKIFSRWGELIYETMDFNSGWDGKCNGNLSQLGLYVWTITYRTVCEENRDLKQIGNVMLVK